MPRKPAAVQVPGTPDEAPAPADDLAGYASEDLPPAAEPTVEQLQAQMRAMEARFSRLAKAQAAQSDPDRPVGRWAREPVYSADEAKRMQAAEVKAGKRPRSLLTPEGWLTHAEMARVAEQGKV